MPEQQVATINVRGQEPVDATPALFSNFLAVSRVATEVQFEFVFLDLNQIAQVLEKTKEAPNEPLPVVVGKTVAKIVMPAASFIQLKSHFEQIFKAIEEEMRAKAPTEEKLEHGRTKSG